MEWIVTYQNFNSRKFEKINILKHYEDFIKKLKKKVNSYDEFANKLRSEMMYRFWSKCEYEVILKKESGKLYLLPWPPHKDDVGMDIVDDDSFDWVGFYDWITSGKHTASGAVKIDVFDQLQYNWDAFVEYCFLYPHKYQRQTEKDRLANMRANREEK